MRRFVIIGRTASASPEFLLDDVPGTSGRLDVALRCIRSGLLVSHGLRRDTIVYLVLLGGASPRSIRIDGTAAKYVRPDERSLAVAVRKLLAMQTPETESGFVVSRTGLAIARGGLDVVLADLGPATHYLLDEGGEDLRAAPLDLERPVFYVGDHLGFDDATRERLRSGGAIPLAVGPVSLHAEDAIAIVANEIDRRVASHAPVARQSDPSRGT